MSFRFEKLRVWVESKDFIRKIYKSSAKFPKDERFALVDQIKRAVVSIALNIAEGSGRNSDKEYIRFLRMAIGSLNETVTCLFVALDLKYLNKEEFDQLYKDGNNLASQIAALINSIK